jgi:hypothetical protein
VQKISYARVMELPLGKSPRRILAKRAGKPPRAKPSDNVEGMRCSNKNNPRPNTSKGLRHAACACW